MTESGQRLVSIIGERLVSIIFLQPSHANTEASGDRIKTRHSQLEMLGLQTDTPLQRLRRPEEGAGDHSIETHTCAQRDRDRAMR